MLKVVLILALAAMGTNAMAEWVGIGRANDGSGKLYANPKTIVQSGQKVTFLALTDFKQTQDVKVGIKPFNSYVLRLEVDCKQYKSNNSAVIAYSKNTGKGEITFSATYEAQWKPIIRGSILELAAKYACSKSRLKIKMTTPSK